MKELRVGSVSGLVRRTVGYAARLFVGGLLVLALGGPATIAPAAAEEAVRGELVATIENGFARLVFNLEDEVDSQVRLANNILTVRFQKPIDVVVDRVALPDYVSVARRDPDGKAIRMALSRKVTMNSMAIGDRLFVDLLPDTWTGLPPGLPRDVIEELARRARDAEKKVRQQRSSARQTKMSPVRVRMVAQPTFSRYVFELPEPIGVAADNTRDRLTLTFDSVIKFDLADVKATLPDMIESIDSELDQDAVLVRFNFAGKVDVRTFREGNSYFVDVASTDARIARQEGEVRADEVDALAAELAARKKAPAAKGEPPKPAAQRAGAQSSAAVEQPQPARPPSPAVQAASPAVAPVTSAPDAAMTPPPSGPPAAQPAAGAGAAPNAASPSEPASAPIVEEVVPRRLPGEAVKVALKPQGDNLTLVFPFNSETPAAVFRRADTLWLVFDTSDTISLAALEAAPGRTIKSASLTRMHNVSVARIKLERPRLVSAAGEGTGWAITLGNEVVEPTRPLAIARNIVGPARSSVIVPIDDPRQLHRIEDPEAGDTLMVVTAPAPARGFLKNQDFIEFRALASVHGVVVQPLADDVNGELAADKVIITRPTGLTLSALSGGGGPRGLSYRRQVIDVQSWGFDRQANFLERRSQLMSAAAEAPESKRMAARTDLARFYLARDMGAEAKAVLDVALTDSSVTAEDSAVLVLRAASNVLIGRPDAALKDLASPLVGNQYDAPLWRAMAYAKLGRWSEAHEGFRNVEVALSTMPLEMQRKMLKDMVRASLEVGDITAATSQLHEFEAVGIPRELEPTLSVLAGRLAEGLGRPEEALRAYAAAADSWDRPAAAQGRLRQIVLQHTRGAFKRADTIGELETLTTLWRGDETEVEALQLLARLYTEEGRYRDAFHVMRTALAAHPNSDLTRRIQEEAAATFDSLFLAGRGDALPAIDALALFYDFRELTPIGRRGDEMIRRLADRLVSVDLLDQAAELLQHQVDHRLQGAARAQVATRLAIVYLMNRKPDRALGVLRATRTAELTNELRNQRLLVEGRALSDSGRHEVALEVIANIEGREAIRLRSDVLWAARRWGGAAEQIELLYGDRWKEFEPLLDTERADILRAAIGYALGEDAIGLMRFREKYIAKMGDGPDRRAFDVITAPIGTSGAEFREIARSIAAVDTLDAFLRDLRARYPETGAMPSPQQGAVTPPTSAPSSGNGTPGGNDPAKNDQTKGDPSTTGSVPTTQRRDPGRLAAGDRLSRGIITILNARNGRGPDGERFLLGE